MRQVTRPATIVLGNNKRRTGDDQSLEARIGRRIDASAGPDGCWYYGKARTPYPKVEPYKDPSHRSHRSPGAQVHVHDACTSHPSRPPPAPPMREHGVRQPVPPRAADPCRAQADTRRPEPSAQGRSATRPLSHNWGVVAISASGASA